VSVRRSDRRGLHGLSDRLASLQVSLLRSAGPPGSRCNKAKTSLTKSPINANTVCRPYVAPLWPEVWPELVSLVEAKL